MGSIAGGLLRRRKQRPGPSVHGSNSDRGYPARVTTVVRSRSFLPVAVALAAAVLLGVVVFVVVGGTALTDPAEIVTRGAQATVDAESFHVAVTLDGAVTDPETGASVPLDGVTFEGDVDATGKSAHVSFAVPFLLGLNGEAIVLGEDVYVKSSLSGEKWVHTPATTEDGPGPEPTGPPTAEEIADRVAEFLATEGVSAVKLADEECGDDTCYHVRITISAEAFAAHREDIPDMGEYGSLLPEGAFAGPMVVDLLFDRTGLWLRQLSTSFADEGTEEVSVTVTLSEYNASFEISPPPSDQITDEEEFPLFPSS